ncbi:MAG TPA: ABC transporter permease [Burkholderiales bacterium]|nr:ABC transporter permease [Burkholderiales bacterium]
MNALVQLLRRPRIAFGALVALALLMAALAAPWLSPHDPLDQDLFNAFAKPLWAGGDSAHLLGTDSLGRDLLSRLIHGARVALVVSFVAALLAGLLGTLLGLAAGYYGGKVDSVVSRLVEIWMSFPSVLLCIVLAALLGAGLHTVVIAIVIIDWTRFCRVVRAEVLVQKSQDYVASAVTIGLRPARILWQEILPNVVPLLLTLFTLEMGIAIVVEAILSFVGLSSANVPTWGGIIQEGRLYVNQAWWLMAAPMLCIIVAVLGMNALGDGLRDALDPVKAR